ncbi:MAG TPA: LysR family transcriptional regulator [Polyangiaceae bacterium]|nr:LysR family transcriptional regulator [Polyangiaceae bacterium]
MDRIELMLVFVRLFETRSFSLTARDLGMAQPTVSKRLQALEAGLGARLLERNTRGLRPTDAGVLYYERCKRWLGEMQEVDEQLASARRVLRGPLRISVPVSLGQVQLARIALRFQRQHPGVQIDLSLTDRRIDMVKEAVDVAIRVGRIGATDVVARELARYEPILVATPAYLERRGMPATWSELAEHRILYYGDREETLSLDGQSRSVGRDPELVLGDPLSLREAIREGVAIGMISPWLVQEDIESGRLARVLPAARGETFPVHALYLPSRSLPARIRAFVQFCAAEVPRVFGMYLPPA